MADDEKYHVQAWKMKMLEGNSHWKTIDTFGTVGEAYERLNELEEKYDDAQVRVLNTHLTDRVQKSGGDDV